VTGRTPQPRKGLFFCLTFRTADGSGSSQLTAGGPAGRENPVLTHRLSPFACAFSRGLIFSASSPFFFLLLLS